MVVSRHITLATRLCGARERANINTLQGCSTMHVMADDEYAWLELSGKKKKRSKSRFEDTESEYQKNEPVTGEDGDYDYRWLLQRALGQIGRESDGKATFEVPKIGHEGKRKSVWTNFAAFTQQCQRPAEHVRRFISSELSTQCDMAAEGSLNLKGRLSRGSVETQCRKYINAFVLCTNCKGLNTLLEHDSKTRLNFICCQGCFARRSVANIARGYVHRIKREARDE